MANIRCKRVLKNCKCGFTLAEITAVMACIAVLAAVLLPVLSSLRQKASREDANRNRAICASNLKQIGLGIFQYLNDYDDVFPPLTAGGHEGGWRQRTALYMKNTDIFRCPSNPNNNWTAEGVNSKSSSYVRRITRSYSMNRNISRAQIESQIFSPATRVLVTEARNDPRVNLDPMHPNWDNPRGIVSWGFAGHLGTMNVLYADGHVKSLLPVKTETPINQWGRGAPGSGCDKAKYNGIDAINCEEIEESLLRGLNDLQQKYKQDIPDGEVLLPTQNFPASNEITSPRMPVH